MPITPDTKDWTWVLHRSCSECGFDASSINATDVAALVRANASNWGPVLSEPDVRERPSDEKWSALEYACHVRDVFRIYEQRLLLMIQNDEPQFMNWDQDAAAVQERYHEQDPDRVFSELESAALSLASRLDSVEADEWDRTGPRSDGAHFTVSSLARYMIHDPIHHLADVR